MTSRPGSRPGTVVRHERLSRHLVRLHVACPGFTSTGAPDEWVALTVPGQYQSRYYTVVDLLPDPGGPVVVLDVVIHADGLVTSWASGDCVGDRVLVGDPKGSYDPPEDAAWLVLVGDLTALPAIGRIARSTRLPLTAYVEVTGGPVPAYADLAAQWVEPPDSGGASGLADLVAGLTWTDGPGYFWMAGESAQMRRIRSHLRHERGWPARRFDVMGYWSGARGRAARAVDPGPLYAEGKAAGLTDEQIWDRYDAARGAR